ncbi:glycoside hydrolase domain-containing protein [Desertivirga xinjiangensis]|uniref:glycoside hydrolase domain-containing protein n=1 Tax=Desertivirga xinjiangensis TaxID=539206 RepID=UPI00210D030E|nr:glycoside hydrolase domain-containing protein [Pedobacter xinjiangensis]
MNYRVCSNVDFFVILNLFQDLLPEKVHHTLFKRCRNEFGMTTSSLSDTLENKLSSILNGNSQYEPVIADGISHTLANTSWDVNNRGNHRALISISKTRHNAVRVKLPWRRPDPNPEIKRIIVVDATTRQEVKNIYIENISSEEGALAFQPTTVPGNYEIYYLPYIFRKNSDDARYGAPWNDYLSPEYHADEAWLKSAKVQFLTLPEAKVLRFEARKQEDLFTSMGLIATRVEEDKLRAAASGDFMLFPEDRAFPIRLADRLPFHWIKNRKSDLSFSGQALKNEYYTFQVGVFAHKKGLKKVRISFSDLALQGTQITIARDSITCFNQEGTGWDGDPLSFKIDVPEGKVQALWIGVSVPANAAPGIYEGWAIVKTEHAEEQKIRVRLNVIDQFITDRGDGELWRHSRLRWLNSTLGLKEEPVAPYLPLKREGNKLLASGKQLMLNEFGLPAQILNHSTALLSAPLSLTVKTKENFIKLQAGKIGFTETAGKISWTTVWTANDLRVLVKATMTTEGSVAYSFNLDAAKQISLSDIQLALRFQEKDVPLLMGIGQEGGKLPALPYTWNWKGPYDSFWAGNTHAGLHLEFQKGSYHGPLLNDYKPEPPLAWANNGRGKVSIGEESRGNILFAASTGEHVLMPGRSLEFGFKLLITPVKDLDTRKHFSERYYQGNPLTVERTAVADGANVINIHHNTTLNPYINYPFIERDNLVAYIDKQHQEGRRVKLYYTIRELTNYAPEIYALKSLGNEIFPAGSGQGSPWLWEHLNTGYKAAWYAPFPDQTADASIVTNGFSRWINYYIEGLRWMLETYKIDGLYLDDVAYDREVIARLRRVLIRHNPNALLDLHSNNNYSVGPANQYTAFFPYIDRLWFGEFFKYNKMTPEQWLVQVSGIPFGLMGEMLEGGGNKWLGMVFGMSVRHSWGSESPAPVWKYWKDFDISSAKMYGYWDNDIPVSSNNDKVKITVYEHKDKLLLAVGNFSDSVQYVTPAFRHTAGSKQVQGFKIEAKEIEGFQKKTVFPAGKPIAVEPRKGWLLEVSRFK